MLRKSPQIRARLELLGFGSAAKLAKACGWTHRQSAERVLAGKPFGPRTAQRIGKAIGIGWQEVWSWQDNDR